jgi:hypothetical protein
MRHTTVITVLAMAMFTAVFGAETVVSSGGAVYSIGTGSANGECKTRSRHHQITRVTCKDGRNSVALDTKVGCLDSRGAAYCSKGTARSHSRVGSQLNCPSGSSYFLFSGVQADNNCETRGSAKSCETSDGKGYARATCTDGCGDTAMAGLCCMISAGACPPGEISNVVRQ